MSCFKPNATDRTLTRRSSVFVARIIHLPLVTAIWTRVRRILLHPTFKPDIHLLVTPADHENYLQP
jgi:hypothetical protein